MVDLGEADADAAAAPVGPINPVILEFPVKVPDVRVDLDPVDESRSSFVAGMTEEY